ncbi:1,4-dihydroxy-2-naphtoate prenyltransferase [Leadbetterella byssophila DSM 17132]|uniref:1,4-dihydroxy-2-naphthoate octaprenyltransferase n=1 Tax=Leadbetterella byssophila (strain DSM 17132 / JCM 16389 / KACC 11308 / NBRC 106382 / 4M15) TaxID=649349 RepID=E4RUU5_LEAB4|nr:1,4-dihydroxy-2-naphthoate octaprenyltransferase [Leadbetterella byssophila]ADQ16968.1 1,4-dihydroxy-2-naphtoate prenyltransferase [Leadbetterella byssophila DSM 17132]
MKKWISAARLRTLPLALSSILMGGFLAQSVFMFRWDVFLWAVITTILLQVMSNFANDYGDTQNGADSSDRIGPARAVQSGEISRRQMFIAICITGLAAFLSGLWLLYTSFGGFESKYFKIFLSLGILAIGAAYTYTAGKRPYGYQGLGDISVFLFFGLTAVIASYFLYTLHLEWEIALPAISCGALATGVLNINNLRDRTSDEKAGKITLAVRLGRKGTIYYHFLLLALAMFCAWLYIDLKNGNWYYLLSFPLILLNGFQVAKSENPDPYLKTLSLTSLFFVIVFGLSLIFR